MSTVDIECSACDFRQPLAWSCHVEYLQPADGDDDVAFVRPVRPVLAWCVSEKRVVYAENLPSLETLVAELHDVERDARDTTDEVTGLSQPRSYYVDQGRRAVAWREKRVSPNRCLSCASTSLLPTATFTDVDSSPETPHPGCSLNGLLRSRLGHIEIIESRPLYCDLEGCLVSQKSER